MKNIIMATALAAVALTACNNTDETKAGDTHDMAEHGDMMDSSMHHMDGSNPNGADHTGMMENASMNPVMNAYFQVKNALANDDAKEAAVAGNEVATAITNVDVTGFNTAQKKMYEEVKPEIKDHAEHISSNGDEIAHQREHFETMSKDLYDLVKVSGTSQTMYYTHCPMYNNNKGASWLSEVKEIRNPYLGKKMPDCGTIKEELK
ncbi:hypothetical protein BH20BAC1_BH20BAC1_28980 [soil metagenome]